MSTIDKWDVIRVLLGLALVACNIGVWRGVRLEESLISWEKDTGKALLIRSLALEAFFAFALLAVDTTASLIQKTEIASANRATEELRQENLKLQAKVIWRQITNSQCRDFGRLIALPEPEQKTVLVEYPLGDPEALTFAITIGNCFGVAWHWKVLARGELFANGLPKDVSITGPFTDTFENVKAAFTNAHIPFSQDDSVEKLVIQTYGPNPMPPYDVKILVGSRPVF
jgi:hypothetical protein